MRALLRRMLREKAAGKALLLLLPFFLLLCGGTAAGEDQPAPEACGPAVLAFDRLFDVCLCEDGNAWAVEYGGKIIHSGNYGRDWEAQKSGTAVSLFSVFFTDSRKGWITGELGTVLHTCNGGRDWVPQSSGISDRQIGRAHV